MPRARIAYVSHFPNSVTWKSERWNDELGGTTELSSGTTTMPAKASTAITPHWPGVCSRRQSGTVDGSGVCMAALDGEEARRLLLQEEDQEREHGHLRQDRPPLRQRASDHRLEDLFTPAEADRGANGAH